MTKELVGFLLIFVFSTGLFAQAVDFTVFDGKGNKASVEDITSSLDSVEVLFLGESHDDSVGHRLQAEIFKAAVAKYGGSRSVALSMEMFERDVQVVVNEYLVGVIPEKQFLAASRPWGNYKTDYRPLVEHAKEHKLPVVAANAPRRYVNMVSRLGRDSLHKLTTEAKGWLAPLPYGEASEAYSKSFLVRMSSMGGDGMGAARHGAILNSQSLWDATMAYSISEFLWVTDKPLVVHLNGSFHTEKRLGTPDHLIGYRKDTKFLVVTMLYVKDFKTFDPLKHSDLGDFVVLTDDAAPRSKR
jgi:uncharacterized iron-regulated protein